MKGIIGAVKTMAARLQMPRERQKRLGVEEASVPCIQCGLKGSGLLVFNAAREGSKDDVELSSTGMVDQPNIPIA
jgi:hypothetical protein